MPCPSTCRPNSCAWSRSAFSSRWGRTALTLMQARLIVACNCALDQEVAAGRFRSDLYYRRNVVERAVVLCAGSEIGLEDLPPALRSCQPMSPPVQTADSCPPTRSVSGLPVTHTNEEEERERITQAQQKKKNNRAQTAAEL